MRTQGTPMMKVLAGFGLVAVILAIFFLSNPGMKEQVNGTGVSDSYHWGATSLVGASPQQVGQFATEYAQNMGDVKSGTPQVLLTRPVTREEVASLGLGCMSPSVTIEEPPFVLVIMKGKFEIHSQPSLNSTGPRNMQYLAYVMDIWSAAPSYTVASANGAVFKKVLNDPTLPSMSTAMPANCPAVGSAQKTLHYGDTLPGILVPTVAQPSATATQSAPPPVQTLEPTSIPEPIATSGNLTPIPTIGNGMPTTTVTP